MILSVYFIDKLGFNINLYRRKCFVGPQELLLGRGDVEVPADVVIDEGEGVVLVAVAVGPGQEHVTLTQAAGTLPLQHLYYNYNYRSY